MTLETNQTEIKQMRIHRNAAILPIPIRFVRLLNWKPFMKLFMVRDRETLILVDEENFTKMKMNKDMRIYTKKLTGSNNVKGTFNYRILIPADVQMGLNLKDTDSLEITVRDSNRIEMKKYGN